jgi:hypothetical protein
MEHFVKEGWDRIKKELDNIKDLYSYEETRALLLKDNFYLQLYGRAKNRTLIVKDGKLYNSVYYHTAELERVFKEQGTYKGSYSFSKRITFIVEYDCDIEKLKCNCGKKYNWTKYCRECPEYHRTQLDKPHREDTKKKMRVSTIKYLESVKGQLAPRYNKNSIELIEDFGKSNGYNFQHAENGGEYHIEELGYFLDAYDKEKNVVLEIDEPRHFDNNGELLEKDKIRQKEITELLGCSFYRIKI